MASPENQNHSRRMLLPLFCGLALLLTWFPCISAADSPLVSFKSTTKDIRIMIGGQHFARYVFKDDDISRPYFCDVNAPGGIQVTRNHPPIEGVDRTDHATYHPGLWLTFGDISGSDFWRNRARTDHVEFVQEPRGDEGTGYFAVRNEYRAAENGDILCTEVCRYTIKILARRYLLIWDSEFSSEQGDFYFGDQEEMGLGIRVATPISVRKGGEMVSSEGGINESGIWGKQAGWCDYRGTVDGRCVGVTLMPSPGNFRRSWFHARDYGLLVANPFGQNAFTKGMKSKIIVPKGESFRLRFGVLIHASEKGQELDLQAAYKDYLARTGPLVSE